MRLEHRDAFCRRGHYLSVQDPPLGLIPDTQGMLGQCMGRRYSDSADRKRPLRGQNVEKGQYEKNSAKGQGLPQSIR